MTDDDRRRRDRRARNALLDRLRPLTTLPRVAKCLRVSRTAAGVGLRLGDGVAGYAGLATCGSVHACPVHAAKIGAERGATEVAPVIRWTVDELGGSVLHVTLTFSHGAALPLADGRRKVQAAWAFLTGGRPWAAFDKRYDRVGWCRAFETTWGWANGWHPHLEVLLFLGRRIDEGEAVQLGQELTDLWLSALRSQGLTATRDRGVNVALATTTRESETLLSRYVTKIAAEVTREDRKTAKGGRFTPFDLLREAVEQGSADHLDLWQEYEQATAGTKQLTWSGKWRGMPDVRTRAGVRGDRSDQEIADADERADPVALVIPTEEWGRVCPRRTDLLDVAETGGAGAAVDWLTARGIRWELPPDLTHASPTHGQPEDVPALVARSIRADLLALAPDGSPLPLAPRRPTPAGAAEPPAWGPLPAAVRAARRRADAAGVVGRIGDGLP